MIRWDKDRCNHRYHLLQRSITRHFAQSILLAFGFVLRINNKPLSKYCCPMFITDAKCFHGGRNAIFKFCIKHIQISKHWGECKRWGLSFESCSALAHECLPVVIYVAMWCDRPFHGLALQPCILKKVSDRQWLPLHAFYDVKRTTKSIHNFIRPTFGSSRQLTLWC